MAPTNDQFYLPFGKELAANEKKNRDKAVRSLKRYLSVGGASLTETDLFKLWKGLFYCYWMSDKPLVQQALANDLGGLILDVPEDNVIPFIKAFWTVHCAEWHGLDRIRLDKYLLLFRRVIFYSFAWLADNDWDEAKVNAYTQLLLEGPLHPTDRTKPDAIVYHILDLYNEELDKVIELVLNDKDTDEDNLPTVPIDDIMRPIIVLSTDALNKMTRKKAKEVLSRMDASDDEDFQDALEGDDLEAMEDDSDDMEEDSD